MAPSTYLRENEVIAVKKQGPVAHLMSNVAHNADNSSKLKVANILKVVAIGVSEKNAKAAKITHAGVACALKESHAFNIPIDDNEAYKQLADDVINITHHTNPEGFFRPQLPKTVGRMVELLDVSKEDGLLKSNDIQSYFKNVSHQQHNAERQDIAKVHASVSATWDLGDETITEVKSLVKPPEQVNLRDPRTKVWMACQNEEAKMYRLNCDLSDLGDIKSLSNKQLMQAISGRIAQNYMSSPV